MKIFKSTDPLPSSETELLHIYNGLDCCITLEVFNAIEPQLDEVTRKSYDLSLALQGPILEMECRGVLVDLDNRDKALALYEARVGLVEESLREILSEGVGIVFNWNSPKQLQEFFYGRMQLPVKRKKGKVTADKKALEKMRSYFYAEPIINHILSIRDLKKKIGVLKTGLDSDGRIRTSYNIAGTDTGRMSSYASFSGSGTNLQNITGELRSTFVADKGKKLGYIDLEQVQSRIVGAICWNAFHDGSYLDACESGDLHTLVCKLVWPQMPWTGNLILDKKLAKQKFNGEKSYRDVAKALGHGTNFYGKPPQMSQETYIPLDLVVDFRHKYLSAFPVIDKRFKWTSEVLRKQGFITTMTGRRRWFFGRRWDDETLRAALAYEPQDAEAKILNSGMLNIWKNEPDIDILLQMHDALVIQFPEEREEELINKAMQRMAIEVPLLYERSMIVPTEAFVGWNWAYASKQNVDGLVSFGSDKRQRQNYPPTSFMDRLF